MNEDYYINLIYKQIEGKLTNSEEKELVDWISQSEENKLTADSIKLAWKSSDKNVQVPDVDLKSEFQSLEDKLKDDPDYVDINTTTDYPRPIPTKSRKLQTMWYAIAAGLALLFALGYLLKVQFMASPQIEWVEVTTGNETKNIILADQSKIFLNKNSTLKYPSEFSKKERLIQFSGEAYFEITHQQKKPFIVNTKHETVTVLGTTFNVRAYDEDINTNVLVTSGKVQFTSKSNNKNLILTKGNKGIYNRSTGGMKKVQNSSFNEVAWHTKNLEFKDTPFFDVIEAIESLYDIQFEVSDSSKYEDCIFTSNFKNATLTEVLETVSTVLDIEFRASSDSLYQIKGGTCE